MKYSYKVLDFISWPLLYIGYVLIHINLVKDIKDIEQFSSYTLISILPLFLALIATLVELANPYSIKWSVFNRQTFNNILFLVVSGYGEGIGKIIALQLLPFAWSNIYTHQVNIWPSEAPFIIQIILGLLLYDFVYYWYHRTCHKFPLLWRLHRLHHSSEKLNTFSLFRFNIIDIILELALITAVMNFVGIPDKVFIIMIGIMTPATVLSHANFNIKIPDQVGWVIINPDNHRIHHALEEEFRDKNFGGFSLFWDRVFGTYVPVNNRRFEKLGVDDKDFPESFIGQFFNFLKR